MLRNIAGSSPEKYYVFLLAGNEDEEDKAGDSGHNPTDDSKNQIRFHYFFLCFLDFSRE